MNKKGKGFLLDTSIISNLLNTKLPQHAVTTAAVTALPVHEVKYLSTITIGEITFGVQRADWVRHSVASEAKMRLEDAKKRPLRQVTKHTARYYGILKSRISQHNKSLSGKQAKYVEQWIDEFDMKPFGIDENDLWIAATALENDLTLISNDSDFERLTRYCETLRVKIIK